MFSLDDLANKPEQARFEIERLRKQVRQMKRKMAEEVHNALADHGVILHGARADDFMSAMRIVKVHVEKELASASPAEGTPDEKENKLKIWKVVFHRLLSVYLNGGKTQGLPVLPEFMGWSMEFLAHSSVNTFKEVQKVMKLPHISYVYKKSRAQTCGPWDSLSRRARPCV